MFLFLFYFDKTECLDFRFLTRLHRFSTGTGMGKDTADLLDTVKILDLRGNEIPISDLWKDRKAVVAFARHFGLISL